MSETHETAPTTEPDSRRRRRRRVLAVLVPIVALLFAALAGGGIEIVRHWTRIPPPSEARRELGRGVSITDSECMQYKPDGTPALTPYYFDKERGNTTATKIALPEHRIKSSGVYIPQHVSATALFVGCAETPVGAYVLADNPFTTGPASRIEIAAGKFVGPARLTWARYGTSPDPDPTPTPVIDIERWQQLLGAGETATTVELPSTNSKVMLAVVADGDGEVGTVTVTVTDPFGETGSVSFLAPTRSRYADTLIDLRTTQKYAQYWWPRVSHTWKIQGGTINGGQTAEAVLPYYAGRNHAGVICPLPAGVPTTTEHVVLEVFVPGTSTSGYFRNEWRPEGEVRLFDRPSECAMGPEDLTPVSVAYPPVALNSPRAPQPGKQSADPSAYQGGGGGMATSRYGPRYLWPALLIFLLLILLTASRKRKKDEA